jgi:hypothetical protein
MSHYDLRFPPLRILVNPHQREAACAQVGDAPFLVLGPQSPVSWLNAVEQMAYYFKRELKFDFVPFWADEWLDNALERDRVLVFYQTEILDHKPTPKNPKDFKNAYTFYGAIGVRWQQWDDAPASWWVPWIWLHPYERRRGHLTGAWPYLLKMFPNPCIERPVSPSMQSFLKKWEQGQLPVVSPPLS